MRKFRRIFRAPSSPPSTTATTTATTKNETIHKTSSSDSTLDIEKGSSSINNHVYSGKQKNSNSFILFLVFDSIEIIPSGCICFFNAYKISTFSFCVFFTASYLLFVYSVEPHTVSGCSTHIVETVHSRLDQVW